MYLQCTNSQGRKSMFKHGGGIILGRNIHSACVMYCARFVPRLLEGFRGMPPPREIFFKWCNLVCFGVYLDQMLSLKNFFKYYFLYKIFINYQFLIKFSKIIIFYTKSKYIRCTLASYEIILLKKCLEAFHD